MSTTRSIAHILPNIHSRREFLKTVPALAALSLSALLPGPNRLRANASTAPHSKPIPVPPPYPDAERAALLAAWSDRVHEAVEALEGLWSCLDGAKALAPAAVDAYRLFELSEAALNQMESLTGEMEMVGYSELVEVVTGRSEWALCIERGIRQGDGNRQDWQREVNAIAQRRPQEAAGLQALLDTRFPMRA